MKKAAINLFSSSLKSSVSNRNQTYNRILGVNITVSLHHFFRIIRAFECAVVHLVFANPLSKSLAIGSCDRFAAAILLAGNAQDISILTRNTFIYNIINDFIITTRVTHFLSFRSLIHKILNLLSIPI